MRIVTVVNGFDTESLIPVSAQSESRDESIFKVVFAVVRRNQHHLRTPRSNTKEQLALETRNARERTITGERLSEPSIADHPLFVIWFPLEKRCLNK